MNTKDRGRTPNDNQTDAAQAVADELDLTIFEAEPESACSRGFRYTIGGMLSITVNDAGQIVDADLSQEYRAKLTTRFIERVYGSHRIKFYDGMYFLEKDNGADGYEQRGFYKSLGSARRAAQSFST